MRESYEYIPCNAATPCKYREEDECFEDLHHEAFPKSAYRTALEKQFRNHVMNKVVMCRAVHDDIHAQQLLPRKGTREEMQQLMEGFKKSEQAAKRSTGISNGALDGQEATASTTYQPTGKRDQDNSTSLGSNERSPE